MADIIKSTTTSVTYLTDGISDTFDIPFSFLLREHIKVLLGSAPVASFTWENGSRIRLSPAPAAGAELTILRETPAELLYVVPTSQPVSPDGLNRVHRQAIYVAEEAKRWGQEAATEVEQEVLDRLERSGVVPYASKAAWFAAEIDASVGIVSVTLDGTPVRYVRDGTGSTQHPDGTYWRMVDVPNYVSFATLSASAYAFDEGDEVSVGLWRYRRVVGSGDFVTAGAVPFDLIPSADGFVQVDAMGAVGDGTTDDTATIQALITRYKKVQLGAGTYRVRNLRPVSSMHVRGIRGVGWRRSALVVNDNDASVFHIPSGSGSVHGVRLEAFGADAGGLRCTFWNQVSTSDYASTYRIIGLDISNEFLLIFRSMPIYWLVDDCQFGFQGGRKGGTQQFRIFVAWSTGAPVNFNRIQNTKHYHCTGDGSADDAAYVLRYGAEWHFNNCTAESFNKLAIVSQREFVLVDWTGGWIEFIDHPCLFSQTRDTGSPELQGCRGTYLNDCRIYLMAPNTSLIRNITGGTAGVRALNCGTPPYSATIWKRRARQSG